ncbi:hypothetical protein SBA4_1500003 [Candidatus Sulfopaludibacter sp. SbA4]|nr:hypothetical protein SBA4_1500003 [Candidatus Sulfopaludibacter sp. SbA4]
MAAVTEYFWLATAKSEGLLASDTVPNPFQVTMCPATTGMQQHRSLRRLHDLALQVRHSKRDEWLIFSWRGELAVHQKLLAEFEERRFTGYRLRPCTVRFRTGRVSHEYSELMVTGWAGMARPESGIRLIGTCKGCDYRIYSPLEDAEKLIDWSQWTGEDFFMVWPLPGYPLITRRVADAFEEMRVRSYTLRSLQFLQMRGRLYSRFELGPLSQFMPQDLATRYGKPLGIDP